MEILFLRGTNTQYREQEWKDLPPSNCKNASVYVFAFPNFPFETFFLINSFSAFSSFPSGLKNKG